MAFEEMYFRHACVWKRFFETRVCLQNIFQVVVSLLFEIVEIGGNASSTRMQTCDVIHDY